MRRAKRARLKGGVGPEGMNMSDNQKIGKLAGAARVSLSASATASASHTFTGRSIVANQEHALAASWQECSSVERFRKHEAHVRFRAALLSLTTINVPLLPCFRGRPFGLHESATAAQMGPPPSQSASGGRYNLPGQPVLYLCDSTDGVLRRIEDDGRATWVQEFAIDSSDLTIVDTRLSADLAFTNQVFWFAESSDSREAKDGPTFSQQIAQLVSAHFEGMLVRGVRGALGAHYSNVVLFRPLDNWQKWLLPGSCPVRRRP
jgi:hypothetical protein